MAEHSAQVKLEKRTIQHCLFSYDLPGGGNAIAMRGDTVELMPHDVQRGEQHGAFTLRVGDEPPPPTASRLAPLPDGSSKEEADAWVASGTVSDVLAAVNSRPESAQVVLEAEQRRGDAARKSLIEALALVVGGELHAEYTKGRRSN